MSWNQDMQEKHQQDNVENTTLMAESKEKLWVYESLITLNFFLCETLALYKKIHILGLLKTNLIFTKLKNHLIKQMGHILWPKSQQSQNL